MKKVLIILFAISTLGLLAGCNGSTPKAQPGQAVNTGTQAQTNEQAQQVVSGAQAQINEQAQQVVSGAQAQTNEQLQQAISGAQAQTKEQAQQVISGAQVQTNEQAQQAVTGVQAQTKEQAQQVVSGAQAQTNEQVQQVISGTQAQTKEQAQNRKAVIYIDKNCEAANVEACNTQLIKKQLLPLFGDKFEIKYLDKETAEKLKQIYPTTPVLEIPESLLATLPKQLQGIKNQAKYVNHSYYLPLFGWIYGEENMCNDGKDNNGDGKIDAQDPTCYEMTFLTSSKCTLPYCNPEVIKKDFMGYYVKTVDYNSPEGKKLYEKLKAANGGSQYLPAIVFEKKKSYMDQYGNLVKKIDDKTYQLNVPGFKYDPAIEKCSTDCNASPACKQLLTCNKSDKPKVELFVMSYCPYGTQAEKGILGAVNALKDKIDFKVKFVNYAMHGKKEIDENTLQYCIQKEEPEKYKAYLTCFLEKGDSEACKKKVNLDMNKINKCIAEANKQFKIDENYNNRASWLSGQFPQYNVHSDLNKQYGIQGSPTLIINGVKVQPESRSPQAYLKAICSAFKNPPEECKKILSDKSYDIMWGWTQNGQAAPAGSCGN